MKAGYKYMDAPEEGGGDRYEAKRKEARGESNRVDFFCTARSWRIPKSLSDLATSELR